MLTLYELGAPDGAHYSSFSWRTRMALRHKCLVAHAYQDFLANARLSAEALAVSGEDTLLSAAPFTHLYGLFTVNMALATGAAIALLPAFSPPALA